MQNSSGSDFLNKLGNSCKSYMIQVAIMGGDPLLPAAHRQILLLNQSLVGGK
jgi:hypothetical protein